MSNEDDFQAVVMDNGSGYCKVGFSGYDAPRSTFPTVIGRPRHQAVVSGLSYKELYIGDEAIAKRAALNLSFPYEHTEYAFDWDTLEQIWHYAFVSELKVLPDESPLLFTEPPQNSKPNRAKIAEIMFEKFSVPELCIQNQSVMSLYASGRTTGVVVDCGDSAVHVVPIYEGYIDAHAILSLHIAGRNLTDYLRQLLAGRGYSSDTSAQREFIRTVKEQLCYVAFDYEAEMKKATDSSALEKEFVLPDGALLKVNEERFKCPEALFSPSLVGVEEPPIHETMYESISRCAIDIRKILYKNLLVAGGSSMFQGFAERVKKEMVGLVPASMQIRVHAPEERKYSAWLGASVLAALPSFNRLCTAKEVYEDYGPDALEKKKK